MNATLTLEANRKPRPVSTRTGKTVKVLCVDDLPANLLSLEASLADMGLDVVKAHSGPEALRCLLENDFALILLDVRMPDMDGFETAEFIRQRKRCQDTPIIFLTAAERGTIGSGPFRQPGNPCRSHHRRTDGTKSGFAR